MKLFLVLLADWDSEPRQILTTLSPLSSPLAESASAPRRACEISRSGITRCGHAEADFVADPLQEPKLDGAFACSVEVVIVHVHWVRAFVESDERMDHRLTAKRDFDFVFVGRSKSRAEHHLRKLLSVADDFHWRPLALKLRERGGFDEIKSDAFLSGRRLRTPRMPCRPLHLSGRACELRFSVS